MAPKAASAKQRSKATGRSQELQGESGESGSVGGSDGDGAGGRRQEVRKGGNIAHSRRGKGLWSRGNVVQGPGFDSKGGASRAPRFLAGSGRGGGRPTQTEQVTDVDMDGYAQREIKHNVQLQASAATLQR